MAQLHLIVRLSAVIGGLVVGTVSPAATESAEAQAVAAPNAAAHAAPQRVANPYYTAGPAAANAAATLAEPQVVYPAVTTHFVNAKGLPRNRVAALGAALSVPTLNDAYRAGVAAREVGAANRYAATPINNSPTSQATDEPARFAPAANTARIPAASTIVSAVPMRRDAAVQPVAWLSDESTTASQATTSAVSPLRAAQTRALSSAQGNPLRGDTESGPGNPLR